MATSGEHESAERAEAPAPQTTLDFAAEVARARALMDANADLFSRGLKARQQALRFLSADPPLAGLIGALDQGALENARTLDSAVRALNAERSIAPELDAVSAGHAAFAARLAELEQRLQLLATPAEGGRQ